MSGHEYNDHPLSLSSQCFSFVAVQDVSRGGCSQVHLGLPSVCDPVQIPSLPSCSGTRLFCGFREHGDRAGLLSNCEYSVAEKQVTAEKFLASALQ